VQRASSYGLDQRWSKAHLRVSDEERALLEAASEQARTSLSDFVRRKALEAAEVDVLDRRIVAIPAKDIGRRSKPDGSSAAKDRCARGARTHRS
jgi:Protein of unknown function (DUF1778)